MHGAGRVSKNQWNFDEAQCSSFLNVLSLKMHENGRFIENIEYVNITLEEHKAI